MNTTILPQRPEPIDYFNLTPEQAATFEAWRLEFERSYAAAEAPITGPSDPRYNAAQDERWSNDPEALGRIWAALNYKTPAWPLPMPEWATEAEVTVDSWPDAQVAFVASTPGPNGDYEIRRYLTLRLSETEQGAIGAVKLDGPVIWGPNDEFEDIDHAFEASAALLKAAKLAKSISGEQ